MADNKNVTNSLPQKSTSLSSSTGEDEQNKQAPSEIVSTCSYISCSEGQEKQKENPRPDLKIDIEEMINNTTRHPLSSNYRCIYRVSQALRKHNENAYTPQIVSIGPLHHEDKHLKGMEDVKVRYLEQFLQRAAKTPEFCKPPHADDQIKNYFSRLDDFLSILKSSEQKIRQCYAEDLTLTSEELLKIILVDAAFIIELFIRPCLGIEDGTLTFFEHIYMRCDLWLIENQVPFFILEELYKAAFGSNGMANYRSFMDLACEYFDRYDKQQRPIESETINHFTDLVRTFHLSKAEAKSNDGDGVCFRCLLSKSHEDQKQSSDHESELLKEQLKSATQLDAAGVKFYVSSSKCLLDIKFSKPKLEIPFLDLFQETANLLRNLMALEQYRYPNNALICDYVLLMDSLIDTKEDVGLLVDKGIINNRLGSNEKVASLFNSLCTNILKGDTNQQFKYLIQELNHYYKTAGKQPSGINVAAHPGKLLLHLLQLYCLLSLWLKLYCLLSPGSL